jgi:hypothetical protein
MLEGKGTVLDVAKVISGALTAKGVDAAVIGGIAVVLHHHMRTTKDIDLWVPGPLPAVAECLLEAGATFDSGKREFTMRQVPVHLVTTEQTGFAPSNRVDIEDVRTVSLADLINLKICSGTTGIKRSQDIADVLGLIKANHLTGRFTPKIAKQFRKDFRAILQAASS